MRHLSVKVLLLAGAPIALAGCVTAPLSVAPGQGKTYAEFQRDDALCRGQPVTSATTTQTTTAQPGAAPGTNDYYGCMASRGELVQSGGPPVYPAVAAYPYPAYGYPYAYPYGYGYPYGFGYGYPYGPGFFGPTVGIGFGIGYGYRGYGGYGGYYRGGYGGGYRGGYHGNGVVRH